MQGWLAAVFYAPSHRHGAYKMILDGVLSIAPMLGSWYGWFVRIIAKRPLRDFWKRHPRAKGPLEAWHQEVGRADWAKPSAVKLQFRSASVLQDNRVVFNVAGNQYRLVAKINYPYRIVYIRFIGTHKDYDGVDMTTI